MTSDRFEALRMRARKRGRGELFVGDQAKVGFQDSTVTSDGKLTPPSLPAKCPRLIPMWDLSHADPPAKAKAVVDGVRKCARKAETTPTKACVEDSAVVGCRMACTPMKVVTVGVVDSLGTLLDTCPPDTGGIISAFLWGFSETRGALDSHTGIIVTRREAFPELGNLLCASPKLGAMIVAGCKDARGQAKSRMSMRDQVLHSKAIAFLQGFKTLWASSRRLRMQSSDAADKAEAMSFINAMLQASSTD